MGGMGSSYPSPQADFLVSTLLFADPLNAHLSEEEKDQIRMSYVYESRLVDEDSKVENDGSFEVADTPATPPLTHFAQLLAFKKGEKMS